MLWISNEGSAQFDRKYRGLLIVAERVAVKRAPVLDGKPKPDTLHVPGANAV